MEDANNTTINYEEEYKKLQAEHASLKASFDKTSTEIADYKRKEKARMSDEERLQAEQVEREKKYKAIERENAYYKFSQTLSATIKDKKVLDEVANAYADGDTASAIEKQSAYFAREQSELEKRIRLEILQNQPDPHAQNQNNTKSWDEMSLDERIKLKRENPNLYNQLKK